MVPEEPPTIDPASLVAPEPDPIVTAAPEVAAPEPRPFLGPVPLGLVYVALGALSFSVMSLLVKLAGSRLPNAEIVAVRAIITLLLSCIGIRLSRIPPWGSNRPLLIKRGLVGFLGLYAFYYAVVHMPLADATVIQNTNPIFAALLAAWWLREGLRTREFVAMAVSLGGVVLIARPSFLFGEGAALSPALVLVSLGGAVCSAAAYVLVRKLRTTESPLVVVFYFALVSVFCAVPIALLRGLVWPTPAEWGLLVGVGLATQFGQVFLTKGLHLERAGLATTVSYLQIVFAIGWGWMFFAERPGLATWSGAALVVGSAVMLLRPGRATSETR
jgi:drug/metabolite transporter (DMT)-like permease